MIPKGLSQPIEQIYENSLGANQHFPFPQNLSFAPHKASPQFSFLKSGSPDLSTGRPQGTSIPAITTSSRLQAMKDLCLEMGWKYIPFPDSLKCGWIDGWSWHLSSIWRKKQYDAGRQTMCGQEWEDWFIWVINWWDVPCSPWKHNSGVKTVLKCTAEKRGLLIPIITC